jgi:hypothetical protein
MKGEIRGLEDIKKETKDPGPEDRKPKKNYQGFVVAIGSP